MSCSPTWTLTLSIRPTDYRSRTVGPVDRFPHLSQRRPRPRRLRLTRQPVPLPRLLRACTPPRRPLIPRPQPSSSARARPVETPYSSNVTSYLDSSNRSTRTVCRAHRLRSLARRTSGNSPRDHLRFELAAFGPGVVAGIIRPGRCPANRIGCRRINCQGRFPQPPDFTSNVTPPRIPARRPATDKYRFTESMAAWWRKILRAKSRLLLQRHETIHGLQGPLVVFFLSQHFRFQHPASLLVVLAEEAGPLLNGLIRSLGISPPPEGKMRRPARMRASPMKHSQVQHVLEASFHRAPGPRMVAPTHPANVGSRPSPVQCMTIFDQTQSPKAPSPIRL